MYVQIAPLEGDELNRCILAKSFWNHWKTLSKTEQMPVLRLLCRERVAQLSVASRAALIKVMQYGPTLKHHELAIRDVFLATTGPDLTLLKQTVDRSEDYHDLIQLLYHDIDIKAVRAQILEHFRDQAKLFPCTRLRILTDVDDTVVRNWADPRYPSKVVYPGVFQLYRELDLHVEGSGPADVVFLTGRGGDRAGVMKRRYRKEFNAFGADNPSVLTGSFFHQFYRPLIFSRKWYNLERHRLLFPEMGVVMFGDTGQADPEFLCQARERYPNEIRAALLHAVLPLSHARESICARHGVVLFDTYVGAATHLFRKGLVSADGLQRVMQVARQQMQEMPFISAARWQELERDEKEATLALCQPLPGTSLLVRPTS